MEEFEHIEVDYNRIHERFDIYKVSTKQAYRTFVFELPLEQVMEQVRMWAESIVDSLPVNK